MKTDLAAGGPQFGEYYEYYGDSLLKYYGDSLLNP
jgi:hypothetical protein